jgi:ligand-binding SRPBCC domain-containing protein
MFHRLIQGGAMISIERRGRYHHLDVRQWLPAPRAQVFAFFADAYRLETITPDWLHFHVLTPAPIDMQAGRIIDYRLRLRGIPLHWQSEISRWEPPEAFIDRQVRGPYRLWEHTHRFIERDGGTVVIDEVDYRVPGGRLIHWLLVERDLRRIFEYRGRKLHELFGSPRAAERPAPSKTVFDVLPFPQRENA